MLLPLPRQLLLHLPLRALVAAVLLAGCGAGAGPTPGPLLQQCERCGDGDSWKDTQGREYRLGLVNAPELDECSGHAARERRRELLAEGFHARVYEQDRYGRGVAVVTTADGRQVNRVLAQEGLVDDRYLAQHRAEHPALAEQLEQDIAEARAAGRGLWGACR